MSRRKKIYKKAWTADHKYNNLLLGRFIGHLMLNGKKSIAENVVYKSFDIIHEKTKKGGLNVIEQAVKNVSPLMELKSRRVGGSNYQVPIQVTGERRQTLAVRWIINACRTRKGKSMPEKLAEELIAASNKEGAAMRKREDIHRMAESNRAFAHFA